jgi:putative protein-disulfide isomerase
MHPILLLITFLMGAIFPTEKTLNPEPMPKLVYFYDPLCGWCYGFSPVIKKLSEEYGKQYEFQVISGGMISPDKSGSINEIAPFIKEAYKTVEESTGTKFGDTFIKDVLMPGHAILSSEKPSRAVTICKMLKPEKTVAFVHDLQKAFYYEGKDLQEDATYRPLARSYGMDEDLFLQMLNTPEVAKKTQEDYSYATSLGVTGFPTVMYHDADTMLVLSRGYSTYEEMRQRIDSIPHYLKRKP